MQRLRSFCAVIGLTASASLLGTGSSHAASEPGLPNWSIATICKADSATPYCRQDESRARRSIAGSWILMPTAWRENCLNNFPPPLEPSWRILGDCLERQAILAADERRKAKEEREKQALAQLASNREATRKAAEDARRAAEAKRQAAAEAKRKAAEAARKAAEEEARRKAEAEAARLRAEAEAKRKAEAEEAARLAAAEEARRKAEEEARRKAEAEAKRIAEQKRKAEEAARLAAAEEARQRAEREAAEREARRKAEAERLAEEKRKAEETARLAAEAEAARKEREAAEAARKAAEDEALKKAQAAEAERQRVAEAERVRIEEAARKKAEADAAEKQRLALALAAKQKAEADARAGQCQARITQVRKEGVINFPSNGWDLTESSTPTLSIIASLAKDCPDAKIAVRGHTDSTGPTNTNQRLSELRAQSVVDFLAARGIDKARLTAVGVGETEPIADNRTRDGRARNRRIEFAID